MDSVNDLTMPRRKTLPPGSQLPDGVQSPLSSNFTIRFNRADTVNPDECVDITHDDPLTAAVPPSTLARGGEFVSAPPRHKHQQQKEQREQREVTASPEGVRTEGVRTEGVRTEGVRTEGVRTEGVRTEGIRATGSARSSGPPSPVLGSPVATPFADKVASFRENLKERFNSHRKNSEDDKEKLLTPSTETLPALPTTTTTVTQGPGLIGKLVKKIEERRGSHTKETAGIQRSASPSNRPERLSGLQGFYSDIVHGVSSKNGGGEARSPDYKDKDLLSPTIVREVSDDASVHSAPVSMSMSGVQDGMGEESFEFVPSPSKLRKAVSDPAAYDTVPVTYHDDGIEMAEPPTGNCPPVRIQREKEEPDPLTSPLASNTPLLLVGALLVAIVVVPMPSFMSGLLFGIILTAAASVRIWFTVFFPRKPREKYSLPQGPPAIVTGDVSKRFNTVTVEGQSSDPPSTWMNQMIGSFDIATFHVNQTQNVYVSLEGSSLRIRKTKNRVLPRRAMYDEELKTNTFSFIESKVFNIAGAEVTLIPKDIPRKRRWLWRFPIGIKLTDPASVAHCLEEIREAAAKQAEKEAKDSKDKDTKKGDKGEKGEKGEREEKETEKVHAQDSPILYLLPRSDREKEDWYWRLMAATGVNSFPLQRPNLSSNLSTLNILVHRICYDVLVDPLWEDVIKKKIQKKLSIIKLPYYIEGLQITDMDLGKNIPVISNVSEKPGVDDRGIWIEMDFEYHGTVQMTLQTKLNLMKLKKGEDDQVYDKHVGHENDVEMDTRSVASVDSLGGYSTMSSHERSHEGERQHNLYESDEADEFDEAASSAAEGGKQKLMRYVEKITESKAFQKLTDVKIVRRAMENVSDTDLALTVVVERLAGRLAINIPHPPSDKIWWGFTSKPDLHLKAFPKFGEREVTSNQVTDWIEKKMTSEFHRLITVPNMDDLTVAVMNSSLDDPEFRLGKLSDLILK